jgi:protein SCO1/2
MMNNVFISFRIASICLLFSTLMGCNASSSTKAQPLPYLGNHNINGQDTAYHRIPDFTFISQDSAQISNASFAGKAYVADFFFTSCPTICPKVTKQMLRIHDQYKDDERLLLLSHTIDTKRDTVGRLKVYAENLGVSADKWIFVTGDKDEIYAIADDYMSIAIENPDAPGGFDHSGWLLLIDGQGHIRSFCDGTSEEKVDQFMNDIDWMLDHL